MSHPWEYIIHGDAEAACVDILINDTPELHVAGPILVTTNMVGYQSGDRRVVITQEGSFEGWPKIDSPRIDVDVYSDRISTAKTMANICLAGLKRQMGHYAGFGLKITDLKLEQGIARIPDKLQETSRFLFSVRLTVVPYGPPLVLGS